MKVTDYIVSFLVGKGITEIFGYPGGVICHFIDSASKCDGITAHINYNEQGSAFAACGYAQYSNIPGVAYSTSGPGATNLITGIANAYFDSTPTIFITGQVDTYAACDGYPVRQRGFQETNVVSMVKDITKWAVRIDDPKQIKYYLEKAYYIACEGNPGPVVLDLPADVQRANVDIDAIEGFSPECNHSYDYIQEANHLKELLKSSIRPVILLGNGVKQSKQTGTAIKIVEKLGIPTVTSLPAFDALPYNHPLNFGFIGTNGHRYANFALGKSDLILSFGSRLDIRQIGLARDKFTPQSKLVRVDIDREQFTYKVNDNEYNINADLKVLLPVLLEVIEANSFDDYSDWCGVCRTIKAELMGYDDKDYNKLIAQLSEKVPDNTIITVDVGQHQLWTAQSFKVKNDQKVYMSAGHGAMGYSLPAAIGVYYASLKPVFCLCGDGGLMMNVQELQFLKREKLPIKILCINNAALGMIRGFQEKNFEKNYQLTTASSGYLAPDLMKLSEAFDLRYTCVENSEELEMLNLDGTEPEFIELRINAETVLEPNFGQNGLIQDQIPYIDRSLFNKLMTL